MKLEIQIRSMSLASFHAGKYRRKTEILHSSGENSIRIPFEVPRAWIIESSGIIGYSGFVCVVGAIPLFVLQRVVKSSASIHSPGTNPHTRSSTIRGREKNNL